jgi:hypothetical protein
MCSRVERAGHLQRPQPGPSGGSAAKAASCSRVPAGDDLAGAVLVRRREAVLGELGDDGVAVAAEHRGHAGGGDRGGGGHRVAALAHEHHRLLGADHAGAGGRGDLADAVPGARADLAKASTGAGTAEQRHESGTDEQRLRHGGVADRLGVASVPWRTRSTPDTVDSQWSRSRKPGTSSQGERKPGVWEPCPGATTTSTGPACRNRDLPALTTRPNQACLLWRVPTTPHPEPAGSASNCPCGCARRPDRNHTGSYSRRWGSSSERRPRERARRSDQASRGCVAVRPVMSATRRSRYRTVFGWT